MAVMLENTTVCVCVGNVYYKLETKQAAKSDYLKWCLKCNELRRGHVDVIVFPDCIRCRVNRIDNEFILEQSLTIIAHYLRTEQFQIHLFNISEMLRMAVMFGTWQLASMCSDYLCHLCAKLVTAKYDSSSVVPINRVLQTLQDEKSFLRHFPNKTYLCALAIRSTFWKYQQEALVEDDLMWNEMRNGAPPAPPLQVVQLPFTHELITVIDPSSRITRPSLFSGLGSEVVAEQYVFVDSEILSMMEMSAVSRRDKDDDELGISVLKSTTSSPRALSDEWELSSVESIDLEKEFPGVDRRTLLLLLSD